MRISDWSSDVCSSDLLIVRNQHRTRHVTGIKLGLGAYIENQRWMLGLQLLRQLSRQDRFAGGNHERAQQRSNNDYRCTQMHDKTFGRWCRHRSEEHTSELQSLMRISYAVFCLKKKTKINEKN